MFICATFFGLYRGHSTTKWTKYLPNFDPIHPLEWSIGYILLDTYSLSRDKWAFTNYVYKIWLFFDHLPPSVYIFYDLKVYKKSIFLTTYPPPQVNIVCERPLRVDFLLNLSPLFFSTLLLNDFY